MKGYIIILLVMLLSINIVYGAAISGTVYDFSLNKISNIIIEINTEPTQRTISKTGFYSFNVPEGNYKITAKTINNEIITTENITVNQEGIYTLDLISSIDILSTENTTTENYLDITPEITQIEEKINYSFFILIIVLTIIFIGLYFYRKRKAVIKPEETDLLNKVLDIIKKEKRTTQKEIRKLIPYSEAKISLILTELEAKGKIQKIKKGRANVIILKN